MLLTTPITSSLRFASHTEVMSISTGCQYIFPAFVVQSDVDRPETSENLMISLLYSCESQTTGCKTPCRKDRDTVLIPLIVSISLFGSVMAHPFCPLQRTKSPKALAIMYRTGVKNLSCCSDGDTIESPDKKIAIGNPLLRGYNERQRWYHNSFTAPVLRVFLRLFRVAPAVSAVQQPHSLIQPSRRLS